MSTSRVKAYAREEAARFGTTAGAVLSRSHRWENLSARKCVIRRLRDDGFTMAQIARWLGYFDHSVVSHHLSQREPEPREMAA